MLHIKPSAISGAVIAPASKSYMQRAVLLAAFGATPCEIWNPARDADSLASIALAKCLGAKFVDHGRYLSVIPFQKAPAARRLECGESGFLLRSASALCALLGVELELHGQGSLLSRPISMVAESLAEFGVQASLYEGRLPLRICGPLRGGKLRLEADQTSQFLSGLLMALPQASRNSEIEVVSLSSRPYVELTLQILRAFSLNVEAAPDLRRFWIPGGQKPNCSKVRVEGDWSSAAFALVAGALRGEITVSGLSLDSCQADMAILNILRQAGAKISAGDDWVKAEHAPLCAFEVDCKSCPDLFPALAVLACACNGTSRINSTARLKTKESSRAEVIKEELSKLGARIENGDDFVQITGGALQGGAASSHGDHRVAMALGLSALIARDGVTLSEPDCVKKSYRHFFDDLAFCAEPL